MFSRAIFRRALAGVALVPAILALPARAAASSERPLDPHVAGSVMVRLDGSSAWREVTLPRGESVAEAIDRLDGDPRVAEASPNFIYRVAATPNDSDFGLLWGLENNGQSGGTSDADVDATEAWARTTGSAGVTVAVVDTGIAYDHPDLSANMWSNAGEIAANGRDDDGNGFVDDVRGWDWYDDDGDPYDRNGHGTHVAGVIGARGGDGYGVPGLNWRVKLMALRTLGPTGAGTTADLARAFRYAVAQGARIVNASLGGPDRDPVLEDIIQSAPDVLFVFAAGNAGTNNDSAPFYPCNESSANVICVAATDQNDRLASFSNYGGSSVDIAAPGKSIVSTWLPDNAATSGTYALADSAAGYANNADVWIATVDPVSLVDETDCGLRYKVRAELAAGDVFTIERSITPGVWIPIDGSALTGTTSASVLTKTLDLLSDGQAVSIRFRLTTNAAGTDDGVFIDEVGIDCASGSVWSDGFEAELATRWVSGGTATPWVRATKVGVWAYSSGTSMAAPHVAGVAALVWAAAPNAGVTRVRNALLESVDKVSALSGKVATGGRLNAARAVMFAPDVTAPVPAGVTVSAVQGARSFSPRWSASDDIAGVRTHDITVREISFAGTSAESATFKSGTGSASASFTGYPGRTYCFAQRAADRVYNRSAWTGEHCTVVPLDDAGMAVASGRWSRVSEPQAYLGTVSVATASGAVLRVTGASYRTLWLVATTCPTCGTVDVYDGGTRLARVSLAASTTRARRVLLVRAGSAVRRGVTLTLRVASSGKPVRIEGLAARAL